MKRINARIFTVNLFYMIAAALLLVIGTRVQETNLIRGLYITEWGLVLIPALIYMRIFKISFSDIRMKKLSIKDGIFTIAITALLYPVVVFMNISFLFIIKFLTNFDIYGSPVPSDYNEFLIYIPAMVLSAGICEEFFFRGIVMSRFQILGKKNAIIISAVLFGIFHFNFQNLIGPVILGLVFGYLVFRTGSIYAAVLGHMTNNIVALTLGYISVRLSSADSSAEEVIGLYDMINGIISIGIIALFCILIIRILINRMSQEGLKEERRIKDVFLFETGIISWVPVFVVTLAYIIITISLMF